MRKRLLTILATIDSKIIPALRQGNRNFNGGITASQFNALQAIANEPRAKQFITVNPDVKMGVGMGPEGVTYGVEFTVNPAILDEDTK